MQIKLLAEGGNMKPGPSLSQKLGPAGIPMNSVIQKVNEATKGFNGMKVPVELEIDINTKGIDVNVFSPPVAELLKKELKIEKGSDFQKKINSGNASIEQIISVAKTKFPNLLCKDLKSAVKTVAGSCVSLGILIENKSPIEIIEDINAGKYDQEINEEKTEISEEKRAELDAYFEDLKKEQEKFVKTQADSEKKEAEEKEEEEESKEEKK
ncbi:50S ribosomal protein L11 [Candidatus Pacearchaeota archaeon]|nr:50S ribosomal protein L11 [Candidatus Pacearchaeota archaeon]|tara:strand:- start:872 stop:1504 length:633 start_codon:yes stop_codon:yes gene_type:complete